jgi:hypothetical protein
LVENKLAHQIPGNRSALPGFRVPAFISSILTEPFPVAEIPSLAFHCECNANRIKVFARKRTEGGSRKRDCDMAEAVSSETDTLY